MGTKVETVESANPFSVLTGEQEYKSTANDGDNIGSGSAATSEGAEQAALADLAKQQQEDDSQ
jgi:hypothetical protein